MDLTQLETNIQGAVTGDGKSAIGANPQDLTGVAINSPEAEGVMRSPCVALKWLDQNNPWDVTFQTFVELEANNGEQGIRAIKNGSVVKEIKIPIYGGVDGDPMKIIYHNNKAIIGETIKYVVSLQA